MKLGYRVIYTSLWKILRFFKGELIKSVWSISVQGLCGDSGLLETNIIFKGLEDVAELILSLNQVQNI